MDKIKSIELVTAHDDYRLVVGLYSTEDPNAIIKISVFQNGELREEANAKIVNGRFATRRELKLPRGAYEIQIQRCLDSSVRPPVFSEPIVYDRRVMAGERYHVMVQMSPAQMYGTQGALVNISCADCALYGDDIFYRVRKGDRRLQDMKFWVPMNGENQISFYVEGAVPEEIDFPTDQNESIAVRVER